jgi:hypothetical protein
VQARLICTADAGSNQGTAVISAYEAVAVKPPNEGLWAERVENRNKGRASIGRNERGRRIWPPVSGSLLPPIMRAWTYPVEILWLGTKNLQISVPPTLHLHHLVQLRRIGIRVEVNR